MERFKEDLVRKELAPIKILMFLIYGGQATLYPYFTVHLKSLGVSIEQTAIIFSVQPIIALLVAPMLGLVADKIGNFKTIFSFFLISSAITSNFLLLVPKVPINEQFHFNLQCNSSRETKLELVKNKSCKINPETNGSYINMTLRFHCYHSCTKENEFSILPLSLKAEDSECSHGCNNDGESQCAYIFENSTFELFSYMQNVPSKDSLFSETQMTSYKINYSNNTYDDIQCSCYAASCNATCMFESQNLKTNCLPLEETFGMTFWSYLGIRLFVTLAIGLVNGLFDAASMTIIQELKADVGFQRVWSTVAMCIFAPVSGYLVDTYQSYVPCFALYGSLYVVAALTSLKLDLSMKIPSENPLKNLVLLLQNPEVILLLIQIAILGICWGFLENFLFWFLEKELGSNNVIMGLTVTVGSGTGLFMALVATWFTKKLGYVNVIIVAFAAYTVRFFGYALAQDAYTCLIFEMMENFTVTLLTVGVTLYCTELASVEMLTTIMTLWNGLHIISGRAFGSLLGGYLVQKYGFRETFKFFAYGSAAFGAFYALMYVTWLRKWRITHRKVSVEDPRRNSSISEGKEEETMKNEAFSSLSMICSFDSAIFLHYLPESPEIGIRRRALSHIPVSPTNSFGEFRVVPRQALSFCEGKRLKRPLSVVPEADQNEESAAEFSGIINEVNGLKLNEVTRF